MSATAFATSGADQIYQSGLESLVAESNVVVAGRLARHSKAVTAASEGGEPIPLAWTVSGQIEQPLEIKGSVYALPIIFSKKEQSLMVPPDPSIPLWQSEYGELTPDSMIVLFFNESSGNPPSTVLPGGETPESLLTLLRHIVSIQAIGRPEEQTAAWLEYLSRARTDEARKVALRSLIRLGIPWPKLAPALERVLADPATNPSFRGFVFGIISFAVKNEKFGAEQANAVRFLGRGFIAEQDAPLSLQYVLNLKLLLSYTGQSEGRQDRLPIKQLIIEALRRRAAKGAMPQELVEQYLDIAKTHPEIH